MPELPDITIYIESLRKRVMGHPLSALRIQSPFLLRTVDPAPESFKGRKVTAVKRIGKRVALEFDAHAYAVIHLMISGRLWWRKSGVAIPRGRGLAAFDFDNGSVLLTEASKKKRASLHLLDDSADLQQFDRGGFELGLDSENRDLAGFSGALRRENHTLKRAMTDPRILSGIGNAYSDEILFAAKLSPFKQTQALTDTEMGRLYDATINTLTTWIDRLRDDLRNDFPEKVTAFHKEMAVHGRYKQPCPDCGAPVQRIVYAERECNYCARCQTAGRLLADRALSRLLKQNWPRTLDELESG